jgi:predicted TIM-barrel fold metal-dependent hydrolase
MSWRRHFICMAFLFCAGPATAQPVADYHQHFFSPEAVARSSSNLRVIDAAKLIELLDAAKIQRAVVLSTAYQLGNPNRPVENEYAQVQAENDWTSRQVALHPTRLIGFCGFNPLKDYALTELERCSKDPHLRAGIKLHIGNSVVELENPAHVEQLQKVFRAANAHRMAIVVHLRASISQKRPYGAKQAQAFLDVVSQAPQSVVQIAHLAGAGGYEDPLVDEAMQVFVDAIRKRDPRVANLYFDASGVTLGKWVARGELIARRIRELGVQRVLFGSDGAGGGNPEPKEAWERFRRLPLTAEELATIEKNVAPYLR